MAYRCNGSNNYLQFSIGALSGIGTGPTSIAVLGVLGDAVNGALVQLANSAVNSSRPFLETFGTLNYGHQAVVRTVSSANLSTLGLVGGPVLLGASKAVGGAAFPSGHYGAWPSTPTHFTAASTLTDGTVSTGTDVIQLGRFLNSATEYAFIDYICAAIFKRELTNTEWDALGNGDYTVWQAAAPDALWRFDNIATLTDQAVGGTAHETGRFGTTITLVADPVGFFPSTNPSDSDSATLSETERIIVSNTDTSTLSEAQTIRASNTDTSTLSEAQTIRASNTDTGTMSEANAATGTATHNDTGTLNDTTVQRISLSDGDGFAMSDATVRLGMADSDAALTSEAPAIRLVDADVIVTSDSLFTIRLYDVDTGTLSESESYATSGGMPTSTDLFTLSESEHISLASSDSATVNEQLPTIRLNDSDSITQSELMRVGLSSTDAAALSESLNTLIGSVASNDTLIVVEQQSVSGGDAPTVQVAPITLSIGVPHITIVLNSPHITIELE